MNRVQVTIAPGWESGSQQIIPFPNGQRVAFVVPPNVRPGQVIQVQTCRHAKTLPEPKTYRAMLLESGEIDRPRDEIVTFSAMVSHPKNPIAKKKSWKRDEIIFSDAPIIPKATIQEFEKMSGEGGMAFLSMVYNHPDYIRIMGTTRRGVVKRGERAVNWKKEEEWICTSLQYANCIYEAMAKKKWVKKRNNGKQNEEKTQCFFMTQRGSQCIRGVSSEPRGCYCTQHRKIFNME